MKAGWIGTGNMGVRMAERVVKAGFELNVYNRTASKAQRVLEAGNAVLCKSPAEIAEKSDIIFTSITNDDAMRAVMQGENGLMSQAHPGQIFVEMSTFSPYFSEELETMLNSKGILYLNAPVIGSMFMIEAGLLKIIASGNKEAYEAAKPYFEAIGKTHDYLGGQAQARYMKIAVNMMICSYLTIYGEVLAAGEAMGFGWDELNDLLEASEGASPMLTDKGTLHRQRIWGSETALTSTAYKDLGLALSVASKANFPLPVTAAVCQYDNFMHFNPKYSAYSTFGTIGLLEELAGKKPGDFGDVKECTKERKAKSLGITLAGITAMLAAEALSFCEKAGIEKNQALAYLGECHGASNYFKEAARGMRTGNFEDSLSICCIKEAMGEALEHGRNAGFFLPVTAVSSQKLNVFAGKYGEAAGLCSIFG